MTNNLDSRGVKWLLVLQDRLPSLPIESAPKPHYSQRISSNQKDRYALTALVRMIRAEVKRFTDEFFFANVLGYHCIDSSDSGATTIEELFELHIGRIEFLEFEDYNWRIDDLCDFIEVFHDIASRPKNGFYHSYSNCGFHPIAYAKASGQEIYRWSINNILSRSGWELSLADDGDDVGRIIHIAGNELDTLIHSTLAISEGNDIAHAVSQFRFRDRSRESKRSAVVTLAGVLERDRPLLKESLRKDEAALFEIANNFDLRHRNEDQFADYDDQFLDWIFYWYLATAQLIQQLKNGRAKIN